jgi:hypothetical protein
MGHIDGTSAPAQDSSALLFLMAPVVLWFTEYLSVSCQI